MRNAVTAFVLATGALLVSACGGPTVAPKDVVGTWRADDGSAAEIDLYANGDCAVRSTPKSIVGPPDATGTVSTSGVWELGDAQGGLEVFLDLENLPVEGRRYRSLLWVMSDGAETVLQHWIDDEGFETVDFRRVTD